LLPRRRPIEFYGVDRRIPGVILHLTLTGYLQRTGLSAKCLNIKASFTPKRLGYNRSSVSQNTDPTMHSLPDTFNSAVCSQKR